MVSGRCAFVNRVDQATVLQDWDDFIDEEIDAIVVAVDRQGESDAGAGFKTIPAGIGMDVGSAGKTSARSGNLQSMTATLWH